MAFKIVALPESFNPITGKLVMQVGYTTPLDHQKLDELIVDASLQTIALTQTRKGKSMTYNQQKLFFKMIDLYLVHWEQDVTPKNRDAVYRVLQRKKFPVTDVLTIDNVEFPITPPSITDLSLDELNHVLNEMKEDWDFVPAIRLEG